MQSALCEQRTCRTVLFCLARKKIDRIVTMLELLTFHPFNFEAKRGLKAKSIEVSKDKATALN